MTREEKNGITKQFLNDRFVYLDGSLYYKSSMMKAGTLKSRGYTDIGISGKYYKRHRLIYIMHFGFIKNEIDHIDGNPSNDKIENLQDISHEENMRKAKFRSNNNSGCTGVSRCKNGKWKAYIMVLGKQKTIGRFKNKSIAFQKRKEAEEKYYINFKPMENKNG